MEQNNNVKNKAEKVNDFIGNNKLIIYLGFFIIMLLAAVIVGLHEYKNPKAEITDNYIKRPYSQLLKVLDEAPADITKQPYEETLPDLVREDIQRMLDSDGELEILYYGEKTSIKIFDYGDDIEVRLYDDSSYVSTSRLDGNISMYKSGDSILIYGSEYGGRSVDYCYKIDKESKDFEMQKERHLDLYGTNIKYDEVDDNNVDMSLVRSGNDFMFYRLGKQVGEKVHFPGGDIIESNYHYILDKNKDLYYMYYCAHPDNAWIQFIKVDNNVSEVTEDFAIMPYYDEFGREGKIKYPIYVKDNKRYSGISNMELEEAYGNYSGKNYDTLNAGTFDYNITIVELTKENASNIILTMLNDSYLDGRDWFIRYYYADEKVYIEERINGLDSYLINVIPKDELKKFDGKEVHFQELSDVIAKLKQLYDKYST